MKKIYAVDQCFGYADWIDDYEFVDSIKDADIILFPGGADVDPELYDCEKHDRTFSDINKDYIWKDIFDTISPNQICLGICRGLRN